MILKRLHLENFGVFINQTLDCSRIRLASILGSHHDNPRKSNGAGKSTMMSAILYALFGKSGDLTDADLRFRGSDGKMLVELDFTMDGTDYTIKRGRTEKESLIMEFKVGDITFKGKKGEVQEQIDRHLKLDHDLLIMSNFFRQKNSDIFTKTDPAERKKLFQKLLQLEIYDLAHEKAKKIAVDFDELMTTAKTQIDYLKPILESITETEEDYKKLTSQLEQGLKDLDLLNTQITDLNKARIKFIELDAEIKSLVKLRDTYDWDYQSLMHSLPEYSSGMTLELERKISMVQVCAIRDIEVLRTTIEQYVVYRADKETRLQLLREKKQVLGTGGSCPTCDQMISSEFKNEKFKQIDDDITILERGIYNTNTLINSTEMEIDIENEKLKKNEEALSTKKNLEEQLRIAQMLDRIALQISEATGKIQTLENQKKLLGSSSSLDEEVANLEKIFFATREQYNDAKIQHQTVGERLKQKSDLQEKINIANTSIAAYTHDCKVYNSLATIFGKNGIPALIIENSLAEIQRRANEYLHQIDPSKTILFRTLKETQKGELRESLDIEIEDTYIQVPNNIGKYKTLSGGEKDLIDFCLHLAFSNLIKFKSKNNVEFVFLDEVFGSLCDHNTDQLMKTMQILQKEFNQIFVISHKPLKEIFPDRIKIMKTEQGSKILYD